MSRIEDAKGEQERTKEVLLDAKRQLGDAMDEKAGPPADDPEQAEEQLHSIRGNIERDIAALRDRVPDTGEVVATTKTTALAVGGGLAVLMLGSRLRSRRRDRKEHEQRLHEQAAALAHQFARLDLESIAAEAAEERAQEEQGGGAGKLIAFVLVAAGAGAAWWARTRTREEPDIWGPSPAGAEGTDIPSAMPPLSEGRPAAPTDVTAEVPTIPINEPPTRPA